MPVLLFVLGIVAVLAGGAMIGFGIPNNDFSFGNTLISAGVTAIAGGFIVIALAAAVTQLRRIHAVLSARPAARPPRPGDIAEMPAASVRPGAVPPRPAPPPKAGPERGERPGKPPAPARPMEPRVAPAPAVETPVEVPIERPRPRVAAGSSEPPSVEEAEEVPLSPREPPRADPFLGRSREPRQEPASASLANGKGAAQPLVTPRGEPSWRAAAPASDTLVERSMFAAVWEARSEPVAPEHEATAPAQDLDEVPMQPPPEQEAVPGSEAAIRPSALSEPASGAGAAEPRPVSILKSGVVDGMAYTLYSDGSIEAELSEGTLRFGSIAELREHLEKAS